MQNAIANRDHNVFPITVYDPYPKAEQYQGNAFVAERGSYYPRTEMRNTYGQMYPYSGDHWRETAAKLKAVVPFATVISRDMGTGVCRDCGQRYAGSSPEGCQRVLRKTDQPKSSYGTHYLPSEQPAKSVKVEACMGVVVWDLQTEFDRQSKFFQLLNELSCVMLNDRLSEFKDAFPAEIIPTLRVKMLEWQVIQFEQRCHNAFGQISMKMSQAGQALQF